MIDASFIREVAGMARAEMPPFVQKPQATPNNVYYLRQPDGTYKRIEERLRRKTVVSDYRSLITWVENAEANAVDIFVNEASITAYESINTREPDFATMGIELSGPFKLLQDMAAKAEGNYFGQRDLIKLLNTRFRGLATEGTVANFRKLKFAQNASTETHLQANKANIGRALEQEVTGTVPEYFFINVPVLDNPSLGIGSQRVTVVVDVDFERTQFCLFVSQDELTAIVQAAAKALVINIQEAVAKSSTAKDVNIYAGALV